MIIHTPSLFYRVEKFLDLVFDLDSRMMEHPVRRFEVEDVDGLVQRRRAVAISRQRLFARGSLMLVFGNHLIGREGFESR